MAKSYTGLVVRASVSEFVIVAMAQRSVNALVNPSEPAPRSAPQGRPPLLRNTLALVALIFLVLECWRPCYFLTDDNLGGKLGYCTEVGRNLLAGRSPFVAEHLFGGGYNMLRDTCCFNWHPFYLLVDLLAGTPLYYTIVDVDAFALLLLAATGFVVLAGYLRREMNLAVSDGWILFYTLSFTYSMYVLTVGASWIDFLANQSALPWLVLGILQKRWWPGFGLVTLFSVHQILGGHVEPTVTNVEFLSLFALAMSIARRSWLSLQVWVAGCAAALVIVLPLLLPAIDGFLHASRSQALTVGQLRDFHVPAWEILPSVLGGSLHWLFDPYDFSRTTPEAALGASAAAWCLLPALISRARWRGLEVVSLGMMLAAAVMICRPVWIAEIMLHLPVLHSMRLPFREFMQLLFFLHLFLVIRPPGLPPHTREMVALSSTCFFIATTGYYWPPTFSPCNLDRQLILGGGAERWWNQVRPYFKPDDRLAVILPQNVYVDGRYDRPYTLLCAYNYAAIAGVVNVSGYSVTIPGDQLDLKTEPTYYFGAFSPDQKAALLAEKPNLKFITLETWHPLKITLSSRDGPTVNLTPFVPPGVEDVHAK